MIDHLCTCQFESLLFLSTNPHLNKIKQKMRSLTQLSTSFFILLKENDKKNTVYLDLNATFISSLFTIDMTMQWDGELIVC